MKLQRNELLLKQQKQEHYRSNLLALLRKLKEEEKQLAKVWILFIALTDDNYNIAFCN